MDSLAELRAKFHSVWPLLDERTRRIMAASEALDADVGEVVLADARVDQPILRALAGQGTVITGER